MFNPIRRTVISTLVIVGLDLAKNVLQVHGADASGKVLFRKKLRRGQVLEFFNELPACVIAMEARGVPTFGAAKSASCGTRCG